MFAFISAIAQAGGIIVDKVTLTRRRLEVHVFIPLLFLFLFLITALFVPFFGNFSLKLFSPYYLLIFFLMICSALIWNVFYYQGVQAEKVHEFELIVMFQPLVTILLAALLVEKNTNIHIIIAAIVAAIALIFAHLTKMHFQLSKAAWGLVLAVIFMSIEIILQKITLEVMSPVMLYFTRTAIIFIFFVIFYQPNFKLVCNKNIGLVLGSSAFGVAQMVAKFYGFTDYGIIYTSLILIASPILVYILSTAFLRERIKTRTIISALVILGCIVYATILGK